MIWEQDPEAKPGDKRREYYFAWLPTKLELRDSRIVRVWLEKYVVESTFAAKPDLICREAKCYQRSAHWCKPQIELLPDALLRKLNGGSL